jgi:hypothetical protein
MKLASSIAAPAAEDLPTPNLYVDTYNYSIGDGLL